MIQQFHSEVYEYTFRNPCISASRQLKNVYSNIVLGKLEIIQLSINWRTDLLKWHSCPVEYYTAVKNRRAIHTCNNRDKSLKQC